jgi:AcrR family transcriptional regulator
MANSGARRQPVQQRSLERWERIVDACAELLDEHGYAALTTTQVARRAGVPVGTLYQFFADKDALIQALAARNLERYLGRLGQRFAEFADDAGGVGAGVGSGAVGVVVGVAGTVASQGPQRTWAFLDLAVDEFVAMRRTVPGFAVVDFGAGPGWDGVGPDDWHLHDPAIDNNAAVARRVTALAGPAGLAAPAGRTAGAAASADPERQAALEVAHRVAMECADAVLKLAFRDDPAGDVVLIGECKRVLRSYLGAFYPG